MNVSQVSGPGVGRWLIDCLESWKIATLTDIQVKALDAGIADGRSMIVSAPTSTGKTLVGEIAALSALRNGVRTIYLVSHKALADQKYSDFLRRFGDEAIIPIASVGLNTGDRAEGDINAQLIVATYEKALGLILTGQLDPANALVVADELQILGDPGRGPGIEALCTVFRQHGIRQFVALTATVENPNDLAGWMRCDLVQSTFHTADLSPQERQVLEAGFSELRFDVCFATSTLAAGVNFPFKSIVFPKLTFDWGNRAGSYISRSEYRNMSGRAGRLGLDPEGYSILLPRNKAELNHANGLVRPDNDRLGSQLVNLSIRKSILTLVAGRLVSKRSEVTTFFQNTLYWYQTFELNPKKLVHLEEESEKAIEWLAANKLIAQSHESLLITPLGKAAALSGLLPATAVQLADMLAASSSELAESFEEWIPGLVYAVCASNEFRSDHPSRFLPFPTKNSADSVAFWSTKRLPVTLDRADTQLAQCAQAITLFIEGIAERQIARATNVSSGSVHRLAADVGWVFDGLHKLSAVSDVGCPQTVSNQIAMLARRVRWGAPAEALDIIRMAERHRVPGFGRQRAMALAVQGITTLHDILATTKEKLAQLLRNDHRAQALLDAASSSAGYGRNRLASAHDLVAKKLGIELLVEAFNREVGVEYEKALVNLLKVETSWVVTVLDDGVRQNVPDILIQLENTQVLLECKTCSKSPALIKKEEAWAILQKAADFDKSMRRVTLGKPQFDETSKKKAAASRDITLVEHILFLEGVLRVRAGSLSAGDFLTWLTTPGLAELERLGGAPTFAPSR